jgi:lipocalin
MFKFTTLLSFALAAAASAIAAPPAVAEALFDGKCTYPKADSKFDVTKFTGRWYQVAATDVIFTKGCSCVFAEYSINVCASCSRLL